MLEIASARPVGLNTPSHSRLGREQSSLPILLAWGFLHRANDNQSFSLANYQLRHTQIFGLCRSQSHYIIALSL